MVLTSRGMGVKKLHSKFKPVPMIRRLSAYLAAWISINVDVKANNSSTDIIVGIAVVN